MKMWMRGLAACCTASHARSTSLNAVRDSAAIVEPRTALLMASTASKSPWLAIGKPASMTSTPSRPSCSAISSFSPTSSEMPGDCSPSRRVVSKIFTWSLMACFFLVLGGPRSCDGRRVRFGQRKTSPALRHEEASASTEAGARSYVRRRLWVRSSFVMNQQVCQTAPRDATTMAEPRRGRAKLPRCTRRSDASSGSASSPAWPTRVWRKLPARPETSPRWETAAVPVPAPTGHRRRHRGSSPATRVRARPTTR